MAVLMKNPPETNCREGFLLRIGGGYLALLMIRSSSALLTLFNV